MGIADLWPVLSTAASKRVPFPVFLAQFYQKHGRPPRLAIDAYMFMFWSQVPTQDVLDEADQRRILRNFMAKLWYLVQNNVLFVVVFDGNWKPGKLRHGFIPELLESLSYDEALKYFLTISPDKYSERNGLVESLKRILQRNKIDWVQAPAEAEAECAMLQNLGIVDYVVSDDSDTMVFGATKILRSFNRVKYHDEDNNPVISSTDYYVTPLEMEEITRVTGLTRDRLIFIAVLRGGDYSMGSEGIGITRAKELAMCGTTMLLDLPRKQAQDFGAFPDFTESFVNSFLDLEKRYQRLANPYFGIKNELDRMESLQSFVEHLNSFLVLDAKSIFGRNTKLEAVKIDDYYAMLYFFPFVNNVLFKFTPKSVSFGQLESIKCDLNATVPGKIARLNVIAGPGVLGYLMIDANKEQWFEIKEDATTTKYALPGERKYNLRPFAVKLLADRKFWKHISFVRTKPLEEAKLAVLRFERVALNEAVYLKKFRKDEAVERFELIDYPKDDVAAGEGSLKSESKLEFNEQDLWIIKKKSGVKENEVKENEVKETEVKETEAKETEVDETEVKEKAERENEADAAIEEPAEDEEKMLTIMVPIEVLLYVSEEYVKKCQLAPKRKSPRKKPLPQKTTLDIMWPKMPSKRLLPAALLDHSKQSISEDSKEEQEQKAPLKKETIFIDLTDSDKDESEMETELSPSKRARKTTVPINKSRSPSPGQRGPKANRKSKRNSSGRNKRVLLPGQSMVTSFFQPTPKPLNNQGSLFVSSDEEQDSYDKLQQQISSIPTLGSNLEHTQCPEGYESPVTSPSKGDMELSPDTSPLKNKRQIF